MFKWIADMFRPEPPREPISVQCEHKNWTVYSTNQIGRGTCEDCGSIITLDHVFRDVSRRLKALESKANA